MWSRIFRFFGARRQPDRFEVQARSDQKVTDYPGCEKGLMFCRDLACFCCENRPSRRFVTARARRYRCVEVVQQELDTARENGYDQSQKPALEVAEDLIRFSSEFDDGQYGIYELYDAIRHWQHIVRTGEH